MRAVLKDIQDGSFARQWMDEYQSGSKNYQAMLAERRAHAIEKTGSKLRERMSWIAQPEKEEAA